MPIFSDKWSINENIGGFNMREFNKEVIKIEHRGRKIHGVSYMPISEKNCPFVIFSHGFNGTNADFTLHSEYLAAKGVGSYCFDFCGGSVNSKSDLRTIEMTLFTEKEDLCAVIDTIKQWDNVDHDNIFLFGASQGGLVTALAAEDYKREIKGILLLYPAFCIPDDWNERFPTIDSIPDSVDLCKVMLGKEYFETIHDYRVFEQIGDFQQQVLIFHGDQDEIVPLKYGEKATERYINSRLVVFPGEGHGFSEQGTNRMVEMTYEFVIANV